MAYEVATATVTIIPNMKGSQEKIEKDLLGGADKAGNKAGGNIGKSLVGAVKGAVTVAAIGKFIGDSLSAGADLQQSLGGIETLFKENADTVKGYASEAYKTAGISANEYMENVTSFSASLIKSMDGDTAAAAELANTAVIDMADNANKMGTDMSSIQQAYQGFAKQNYTMLDNLKLGYGGTKTEMERLLADATELSGVEYNIDNLNDVYEAIHVIQQDLGITGTTAKESAETFSGSFASMKAAATDLMGNLSLGNDIAPQIQALGDSVSTFVVGNLLPMVSNIAQQLPTILGQLPGFIADLIPQIIPLAGQMISGLAQGIIDNIPTFVAGVGEIFTGAYDTLVNADWAGIGTEIVNLLDGAWQALTGAAQTIWDSVVDVFTSVIETVPILSEAWDAITATASSLWDTVTETFTSVISTVPILSEAWDAITATAQSIWDTVVALFTGEIKLSEVATGVWDTITETAQEIWTTVTGVFTGSISVVDILTDAWDGIIGLAQGIWDSVVAIFTGGISTSEIATDAWDTLTSAAQTAWDSAKAVFETGKAAVQAVTTKAWDTLESTAKRLWNRAKAVFAGVAPVVKSVTLTAWGTIPDTAQRFFDSAKSKFEGAAPVVKAVVTDAWETITKTAGDIWTEVKNIFSSFEITWPDFGELASGAFEGLKNAAKSAWDWVKSLFGGGAGDETVEAVHGSTAEMEAALAECSLVVSDVDVSSIDTANGIVQDAASDWESTVSGVSLVLPTVDALSIGTAVSIVEQAAAQMQAAMNFSWSLPALHGSVPSISVSMASASSSDGKTTVSYPVFNVGTKWFAEGGIFNQPSIIGVGEAGAEAALPLDAFWRRLDAEFDNAGTGATINNYIEVNGATDPVAYADELARELEQQLKRA